MASERVAIVTAGGSGMGAGAARKLAEDGIKVAVQFKYAIFYFLRVDRS